MNYIQFNENGTLTYNDRTIMAGFKAAIRDGIFYLDGEEIIQEFLFGTERDPKVLATLTPDSVKRDWRGKYFAKNWVKRATPKHISIITNVFTITGQNTLIDWNENE